MEAGNPLLAVNRQRPGRFDNPQVRSFNNSRLDHPLPPPSPPQYYGDQVLSRQLDQPAMAAATVLPPSSHYQSQQSSYSSGYLQQPSIMLSSEPPPPPRRSSDESESSNRQSLPSISEVISGTRPGQYPPPPARPCLPSAGSSSLHSPFLPATARSFPESEKHSSPHTTSAFVHRQDPLPPFSTGSPRPPFNGRPSLPPVTDRRLTPPTKHEVPAPHSHITESQTPPEPHSLNGSYTSQHPPAQVPVQYQPGQLPPGQQPLPNYPVSPRHAPSHGPGLYDSRAPLPPRHDDQDYVSRSIHEPVSARITEGGSYREALGRIGASSRTVFNFAEAYGRLAREQHGPQPIPERLPTEREVGEMLSNVEYLKNSLEHIREIVLVSIQSERYREDVKRGYEEDPDIHMYSDSVKPHYMAEVKKRRGRAAPPGRCHSCNRIDTPEWRRGPDGARTLCNACGLHYAKLERKRQIEARSTMRPIEDRV